MDSRFGLIGGIGSNKQPKSCTVAITYIGTLHLKSLKLMIIAKPAMGTV